MAESEIKWIKLSTGIFDNDKIKQIEALPEGDSLIVIWLKLLVLAGEKNDGGAVYFTKTIPYSDQMLSVAFRRPLPTVQLALRTFESFGMIEIINDFIMLPNWEKYQNVDGMERIREQNRIRQARKREKERLLLDECHVTVTEMSREVTHQNKNKNEKEEDSLSFSDENDCRAKLRLIAEKWNEIGVNPVKTIAAGTTRGKMILARVREHGLDVVLQAIEMVKRSPFLRGENSRGWMITLEWFAKPNNFIKVSEGQYSGNRAFGGEPKRGPNGVRVSTDRTETDEELDRIFGGS